MDSGDVVIMFAGVRLKYSQKSNWSQNSGVIKDKIRKDSTETIKCIKLHRDGAKAASKQS